MNHFSKVWAQASEGPSKVSDRPVSGSRIEKETLAGSCQTADAKEPPHLHKGPHPHPHHGLVQADSLPAEPQGKPPKK